MAEAKKRAGAFSPEDAMRLALRGAARGDGLTWPNPSCGAVIFRGSRVLGRGTTRPIGGDHAEIGALAAARRRHGERALRGASLAVTLEPCVTHGRTGPCTDALIAAGIKRVYYGCRDSHCAVRGRGIRRLRSAGIRVESLLLRECREKHRGFLSGQERGRPYVVLKLAASLDGRIATAAGESRWITGPESRRFVHELRARSDAILIGSGTAIADDPRLDARRQGRAPRSPVRVLVDSKLRVPEGAKLYRRTDPERTWVLCAPAARGLRSREALGARLLETRLRAGRIDLARALSKLAEEGLTEILVEGGGQLAAALLRAGLVDAVHWFVAPKLLGGDGKEALAGYGIKRLADATALRAVRTKRMGSDVLFSGTLGDFP